MGLVWLRPFLFFTEESLFRDLKLCASFVWRDCYRIYIGVILDNWCSCFKSDYQYKSHNLLWGSGLPSLSSDVFTYIWAVMWRVRIAPCSSQPFFPSNLLVRFFLGMQCFFLHIFLVLLSWISFHCPRSVQSCFSYVRVFGLLPSCVATCRPSSLDSAEWGPDLSRRQLV